MQHLSMLWCKKLGQLRGHTLENKWQIYKESKKCGFKNMIVASFSHMTRVDDVFVKQLVERGEDRSGLFGFSEITNCKFQSLSEYCDDINLIDMFSKQFIFCVQTPKRIL